MGMPKEMAGDWMLNERRETIQTLFNGFSLLGHNVKVGFLDCTRIKCFTLQKIYA